MSSYIYLSLHRDAPTTAVVAHGQMVFIDAPAHIQALHIGGQSLRRDPQLTWWVWQVPRRTGRLWLLADDVPMMTVEIVSPESYDEAATTWYRWLTDIDPRLTHPARYWQPSGIRRVDLEDAFGGAPVSDILHMVMRVYDDAHTTPVEPWYGDLRRVPRLDRPGVHGSDGGWLVGAEAKQPLAPALQRALLQALAVVLPVCDQGEVARCQQVVACVRHHVAVHHVWQLQQLNDWAQRVLALVATPGHREMQRPYPDLALLYERWVWVNVLACVVGFTALQQRIGVALDTSGTARIEHGADVWCGYQPRLLPQLHAELWSRDDRVAIPDVVIACQDALRGWRAVVFDAKFTMIHRQPTGQARTDVSAYLVRIGVGHRVPDWAVLMHPGSQRATYASGLHVYGTAPATWDEMAATIQAWLAD